MNWLLDFLFPKPESVRALESLSPGELCISLPAAKAHSLPQTIALFSYEDPRVRELIWEIKYHKNRILAAKASAVLLDVLLHELAERALSENFVSALLIPMPMSKERIRERGYNQCELLAAEIEKLDRSASCGVLCGVLVKHHHTESQAHTPSRQARLENLKDSMHVSDPSRVSGRNIILLDDVVTTGASFTEAKRALQTAGAKRILSIALAH